MTISKATLIKYMSEVFVECGSGNGDGIQTAIDCCFPEIKSCEPDVEKYKHCLKRFQGNPTVSLYNMTSIDFLTQMLTMDNDGPSKTFWIDAHVNGRKDKVYDGPCQVLKEIEIISNMVDMDHYILIDDIRLFRSKRKLWGGIGLDDILAQLIVGDYHIDYDDGYKKDDILVAKR